MFILINNCRVRVYISKRDDCYIVTEIIFVGYILFNKLLID